MQRNRTSFLAAGLAAATALLGAAGGLGAQTSGGHHEGEAGLMPLYTEILGEYTWSVSTRSEEAQAYFDQGTRLMYAYTPTDARRSYEAARTIDPQCAMCWWGEAWSIGPYLNGGMRDQDAPAAYAAAQRAVELSERATPVERAMIEALAVRYRPEHPSTGRRGLDSAFVDAMADVYRRFPEHPEVATVYADALMLLEPRRGIWSVEKPSVALIHGVLEGVLEHDLGHPGACHAYVHATETTPKVYAAQACADLLGSSIPGASHINHMPSHTYNRVGRWGDATKSNIVAWQTDLRAGQGEGFAIYPAHNLHMLLFSAAMDGQGAIAIQAARDYSKLAVNDGDSFRALNLLRFGRFDEVLELETPPVNPIPHGFWAFARGHAHLRLGAADSAAIYLALVDSLATHAPPTRTFRVHRPDQLLGIVGHILRGEILREEGRVDAAVAEFGKAIEIEHGLIYDEPEPLPFAAGDWLGALLLEAGRPTEAERVYEAGLVARPNNGWSLVGLEQALRAQGRTAEADAALVRFREAWVRSEVWLPASRY